MKKKNRRVIFMVLFLYGAVLTNGVYAAPAYDSGVSFKDIAGKEWILSEFTSAGKTVRMDRQKLIADNMGEVYSMIFREEASGKGQVNGMGAPNRYFGPFTAGANRALSIGLLGSTMMVAFREPDGLKENEYFAFLSKVSRWDLKAGRLELHSTNNSGAEVVLVFAPK